ncbi:hypothetical protein J5N97_005071 [Dioscorea zingiberensis]|uniref:Uncharacterized protein n=1 Tax=Dioscorea zingiberensis TaxID=325984 RepID=A0A9D5CSN9_9LILI|nr:hypothetical protein J5N97_013668 [Dioscorea zingiberensis]KAJ0986715.1 hypothetical protein J5N97_005071 [Dioscorea zingiberensis]
MDLGVRRLAARVPHLPRCSKDGSPSPDNGKKDNGDEISTDWDKAWSSFRNQGRRKSSMRKQGKKSLFSQFNPEKYVSRNPRRSEYPLSEEVDPIKRTERSNLMLWTSPQFTLAGAIVVVSMLLVYTLSFPLK